MEYTIEAFTLDSPVPIGDKPNIAESQTPPAPRDLEPETRVSPVPSDIGLLSAHTLSDGRMDATRQAPRRVTARRLVECMPISVPTAIMAPERG